MKAAPSGPKVHRSWSGPAYVLGCLGVVAVHLVPTPLISVYELLDFATLPVRFEAARAARPAAPVPEVVVVGVDDASLERRAERWPWRRAVIAELVDRLHDAGARAIGLDLYFAGPNAEDPEGDRRLEASIRRAGNVVLATSIRRIAGGLELPRPYLPFLDAAAGVGAPMQLVDSLGQATRFGVEAAGRDQHVLGFPLAILRVAGVDILFKEEWDRTLQVRDRFLTLRPAKGAPGEPGAFRCHPDGSLDQDHRYHGSYPVVSAADVLEGVVPPEVLRDRLVLVGVTARSLPDRFNTPIARGVAGVELHAIALASLLRGEVPSHPLALHVIGIILGTGLAFGMLGWSRTPRTVLVISGSTIVLWGLLGIGGFALYGFHLPLARPVGLAAILTLGALLRHRFRALREVTEEDVIRAYTDAVPGGGTRSRRLASTRDMDPAARDPDASGPAQATLPDVSSFPSEAAGGATSAAAPAAGTGARTRPPSTGSGAATRGAHEPASTQVDGGGSDVKRRSPIEACHMLLDRGRLDEAAEGVRALDMVREPVELLFRLATRFQDRAALEPAEALYQAVYARDPGHADVEERLLEIREKLSRFDEDDVARMLARQVLHPRFEDPELVGRGGMGFVFRVRDRQRDGATLALKMLSPFLAEMKPIRERFTRESELLAGVRHPHLVVVHDVFPANLPYYSMEFLKGRSLERVLQVDGPMEVPTLVPIVNEALEALHVAHEAGIVHRDLKPANLMLDDVQGTKVVDFGVAHFAEAERLTQDGQVLGTLRYMSPEQLAGEKVDARSDLYSMAVVIHELATGALPFRIDHLGVPRSKPDLARLRPDAPLLCEVLETCLAKDPAARPTSAFKLRARLAEVLVKRGG